MRNWPMVARAATARGEFPLVYWGVGQLWKVIGQCEFAYRPVGLLFHFFASYALFLMLRRCLKSDFWAIGISLLWSTSPVIVYYTVGFLTDVPAYDLALIGWYFFMRYAYDHQRKFWILCIAFWALASLLKVTAGMSLVAVLGVYVMATLWPSFMRKMPTVLPRPGYGWGVIAVAVIAVFRWYA